jgi:hypothetical protein
MNTPQRPVSVTILACTYLVVGAVDSAGQSFDHTVSVF